MQTECLENISRRSFLAGGVILIALPVVACSAESSNAAGQQATAAETPNVPASLAMQVYKDPACGCCTAWAEVAQAAGYQVTVSEHPDMASVKRRLRVPEELWSCHTAEIGRFAIEGHVPMESLRRLLQGVDQSVLGLAVVGMPRGSPGMEMADGSKDPYRVMSFAANGQATVFDQYPLPA